MVAKGYFRDELIQHFSPKLKRRSPLINIGYCVRAIVVDEGISFFLKKTQHEQTQVSICVSSYIIPKVKGLFDTIPQ